MDEGSVRVEGEGFDDGEDSVHEDSPEVSEAKNIDNQDGQPQVQEGDKPTTQPEEGQDNGEPPKTDKGTKLDRDPLSQANQLRANAEAKAREYEEFLNNPQLVLKYADELRKDMGVTPQTQPQTDDVIDPDRIETTDDLKKYAKQLKREQEEAIQKVTQELQGIQTSRQQESTAAKISSSFYAIENKFPEFRTTNSDGTPNPDHDPELQQMFEEAVIELDYDPKSRTLKGGVDYLKLAERLVNAKKRGESNGSRKAQTIIEDRRGGRVVGGSGGGASQPDESKMSASQVIASRMARARRG